MKLCLYIITSTAEYRVPDYGNGGLTQAEIPNFLQQIKTEVTEVKKMLAAFISLDRHDCSGFLSNTGYG